MPNPDDSPVLTVTQLTHAIKFCLEGTFPSICLRGEVSNCKLHTSGHLYLSIKDQSAQIAAVMYRADATRLRTPPKDGDQIIVKGELNVYVQGGKYQLIIKELRPAGLGELLLKLEELKIKLNKKGYFKKEHKKPLPTMPQKIGVVTSPTGAAIQDMLNILTRRFSGFHLILNPVKVQGEGAAQEIAQAIRQFNAFQLVDVIIVGRGGGSIEDLWAFNEEIVADAIYESKIPIISAVGHETDHCIADYVADIRAPTPSAAAEIVIGEREQLVKSLYQMQQQIQQTLRYGIRHQRQKLSAIERHPLFISPYGILGPWMQKMDDLREDIDLAARQKISQFKLRLEGHQKHLQALRPMGQIAQFHQKLFYYNRSLQTLLLAKMADYRKRIHRAVDGIEKSWSLHQNNRRRQLQAVNRRKQIDIYMARILNLHREQTAQMAAALQAVNPKNLLSKGYAIIFAEKERSVITSVSAVKKEQELRIFLSDGEILSTVKTVNTYE